MYLGFVILDVGTKCLDVDEFGYFANFHNTSGFFSR